MPINEVQRQAYLNALGVQSYFPRYVLPGAKPSQPCQWPEAFDGNLARGRTEQAAGHSSPAAEAATLAREDTALFKKSLEEKPLEEKSAGQHGAEIEQKAAVKQEAAENRFKVSFLVIDGRLAVISHLPYAGPDYLSARHLALLNNVVKAMGLKMPPAGVKQIPFGWPLSSGALVDNSEIAGREALQAFLEHNMDSCRAGILLIMGEGLVNCLEPGFLPGTETEKGAVNCAWQTVITKSLDQMLRLPEMTKPDVWRVLRKVPELF